MNSGGKLAVSTNSTAQAVTIVVKDNGAGMDSDILDNIFRPFSTTKETGTGLGLVIFQRIVHEHGGEITVKSSVGEGTVLSILLPRAQDYF